MFETVLENIKLGVSFKMHLLIFNFIWCVLLVKRHSEILSSRVCAVAQYAVLEANGRGPFSHPTPPKPLNQFRFNVKYTTTSPQGVDAQNWVGIVSAATDLRMREKKHVLCGFFY